MAPENQPAEQSPYSHQLEGRVTSLEVQVSGLIRSIERTNETVNETNRAMSSGFKETRAMIEEFEKRNEERSSRLQDRLTQAGEVMLQRGQVSWPLVISIITLAILLTGSLVAFVSMRLSPMSDSLAEVKSAMNHHIDLDGHPVAVTRHEVTNTYMQCLAKDISDLRSSYDAHMKMYVDDIQRLAVVESTLASVAEQQKDRWPVILSSTENTGRINAILSNLQEAVRCIKDSNSDCDTCRSLIEKLQRMESRTNGQ